MSNWGISESGYNRPNQAEIREQLDDKQRELFGANVNLSDKSPNGIINGILSWAYSELWMQGENLYHSGHPTQAQGVALDYLAPFYGTSRRSASYAIVEGFKITGTPNYVVANGKQYQTEDGIIFTLSEDIILDAVTGIGYGILYCNQTGVIGNVPANTITVQTEPDSDIISVTNPQSGEDGQNRESDDEFRERMLDSQGSLGSGTLNAIYTDLLDVDGVRAVQIKVNESDVTDSDGLPPHSIGVYTYGGDNDAIAKALFENYVGLQFYGSTIVSVNDVAGNPHNIGFTLAETTEVGATISLTTNSTFGTNGVNDVKDAVISIIGGTDTKGIVHNGYNMGDDVIYLQIAGAIMGIQGVTDATVEIGVVGSPYSISNIVIDSNKVANTTLSEIEVTVL